MNNMERVQSRQKKAHPPNGTSNKANGEMIKHMVMECITAMMDQFIISHCSRILEKILGSQG